MATMKTWGSISPLSAFLQGMGSALDVSGSAASLLINPSSFGGRNSKKLVVKYGDKIVMEKIQTY